MATNTLREYLPHVGAVWSRVVDLLYEVSTSNAKTFAIDPHTIDGYRSFDVHVVDGPDTTIYELIDLAMPATEKYNFDYFFQCPGVRKVPKVMPQMSGARNCLSYWDSQATGARSQLTFTAVGWSLVQKDSVDVTVAQPPTRIVGASWRVTKGLHIGYDFILATADSGTAPVGYVGSNAEVDGMPALAPMAVVSSGGGSVDTAPIVAALNDIALIDVDYSANNGGTVFSLRGKVRT